MGYTHYWYKKPELPVGAWDAFVAKCRLIIDQAKKDGIKVTGGMGVGRPTITGQTVRFNGAPPDDYETFEFRREVEYAAHELDAQGRMFDFTKTENKPYDPVVCACLIAAKVSFGDDIRVSSDGEWEEWAAGRALYARAVGETAVCPFDEE